MRDYKSRPPSGTVEVRPYGERLWAGRRYYLRQVWTWRRPRYDLSFEITPADGAEADATVVKTSYLAIPVEDVAGLMRSVGFENVGRVDGRFFYVQAKRWQQAVGRPEGQAFYGALAGQRATKGVFITTSAFTSQAVEFARSVERVVLVDGIKLADLMIDHEVGVTLRPVRVPKLDGDYFEEESV